MITVSLSSHRIEILDLARREMERHDLILMEEPPHPDFHRMLRGELDVREYIRHLEAAFPKYSELVCMTLKELYKEGRAIRQVEPYLEILNRIYDMLEEGKSPEEIQHLPAEREVYLKESMATKALLDYYSQTMQDKFESVVEGVKNFAGADAERGKLREKMRAEAIAHEARNNTGDIYVETGYLHFPIVIYLKRVLEDVSKVRLVFLQEEIIRGLTGERIRQVLSPGDVLTLRYAFGKRGNKALEDLLAARSLIYIKLLTKDEIPFSHSPYPHTEEEIRLNRTLRLLGYDDCKSLYKSIRFLQKGEALEVVKSYLKAARS